VFVNKGLTSRGATHGVNPCRTRVYVRSGFVGLPIPGSDFANELLGELIVNDLAASACTNILNEEPGQIIARALHCVHHCVQHHNERIGLGEANHVEGVFIDLEIANGVPIALNASDSILYGDRAINGLGELAGVIEKTVLS